MAPKSPFVVDDEAVPDSDDETDQPVDPLDPEN